MLLKVFGVWYLAASAIGFVVGATNGFLLNRRWTFREHVGDALTPVRWGIVQSCGLGVNEGLLYLFVHDAQLDKLLAQVLRDCGRHGHHVLRQPCLDVPRARARDGGRRRRERGSVLGRQSRGGERMALGVAGLSARVPSRPP